MAVFFLFVAGSNLAIGFMLAMYLVSSPEVEIRYVSVPAPVPTEPAPPREPAPLASLPPAPPVAAADALVSILAESGTALAEAAEPEPSESSKLVGASIVDFKAELNRYRDQLAAIDQRMRVGAEAQDAVAMQECLTTLRSANNQYLDQQSETSGRLQQHCQTPELEPINRQVEAALDQQVAQMKSSNLQLESVDLEKDLLSSCQILLDETSRLVDANHAMRDALDDAELLLGRPAVDSPDGEMSASARTKNLVSRTELEAALGAWWKDDARSQRPLAVGLVDLDRLRELNEAHGLSVGDRILDAAAQVVSQVLRGSQVAARMTAQKFLIMFPDLPARDATNILERIRQQLETTRFVSATTNISITLSCSVAEAVPEDTLSTLLSRVETTLQEAKRYGRNRTFLHDGKFPAPVVPPVLSIEGRVLTV